MTFTSARLAAALVPLAIFLAGCEEFEGINSTPGAESNAAAQFGPSEPRTEVRDVERPDVFSVTETGLWDGRPSLGGIWVAHPDVTDPERANITNQSNGKTVAGALFRRERANPGPPIQVSSEAAAALGMLAGQPVELSIVAVRQEEFVIEPEPLPLSDEATGEATIEGEAAEPPTSEETAASENDDPALEAAIASGAVTIVSDEPPKKGFWASFRDSFRKKPAAGVAAEADAARIEETTDSAAVPEVDTVPLDPVATAAAAAITAAETEAPKARPAASKPQQQVQNPYVQVGLFSVEENASSAAASLRQAGIVPTVQEQNSGGRTLWRVFVGPVNTVDDQAELLAQIKKLGYQDAFLAPN